MMMLFTWYATVLAKLLYTRPAHENVVAALRRRYGMSISSCTLKLYSAARLAAAYQLTCFENVWSSTCAFLCIRATT